MCKAYKDFDQRHPEKFKKLLDAYFAVSKNTHTLYDAITANIENVVGLVWSVFTSGNQKITKEKMDQIGGAITRFYESYPDSVALDLAYCIKEGISFENEDDLPSECQERFFRFLNRINELSSPKSEKIFRELYSYLTNRKKQLFLALCLKQSIKKILPIGLWKNMITWHRLYTLRINLTVQWSIGCDKTRLSGR